MNVQTELKSILFISWPKFLCLLLVLFFTNCKKNTETRLPTINLIFESWCNNDGDTIEIGKPIRFKVQAEGLDANLTNFTVKKYYDGQIKTVLDSGLNSSGFVTGLSFYQNVENQVEWRFAVMDRNRNEASVSLNIFKDPNSVFGGIYEFLNLRMGYQQNNTYGHFFLPVINKVFFGDSAALYQDKVDFLTYFNYREDNGILKPSPTFSSPGEELSATGELYDIYYPFLCDWTTRNYTKYDVRAVNGVTAEAFNQAHNDSLLIVSYDDVWGKKKYKWASDGTLIPFMTQSGKKGIIYVHQADNDSTGSILFSMKIQM
ncbi:MAG: hypothetical protein PHR81_03595 [Bacteroidales bacterium]|jgi:hypothetical protein|nr:hypothetical protein [Bacteroidales bacterium]MDD4213875.1 hypothetical protein [Bacteroidales bacterium]